MRMEMINVIEAERIIQSETINFGVEEVFYEHALGRVLAEHLYADRDLPPFNRATVDGIAIDFNAYRDGLHSFRIKAIQAAGETPIAISRIDECVEIMTGAALDESVNTVVRYEDLLVANEVADIRITGIKNGQNIHFKGKDKQKGQILAEANQIITPSMIGVAASVGKTKLLVKRNPRIVIISTGDEMVSADDVPTDFQLRRSNGVTIKSVLEKYKINADLLHLNDDFTLIKDELTRCLEEYDVLLMSGGVSMGKFDYVPQVLDELGVGKLFHKVKQRPGKPFWFGKSRNQKLVFAFPGNPVSVFMCLHRYFIPWLEASLGLKPFSQQYAILENDIYFQFPLQFFAQVKLRLNDRGMLMAKYVESNGSGDFSNLISTEGFMELALEKNEFKKGEVHKVWTYNL